MTTATKVRTLDGWRGDARLFRLSEPVASEGLDGEVTTDHVIVSAVVAMFDGPETYIFPANPDGTAINHLEMPGSFRGSLDHAAAIAGAGWELDGEA